MNLGLALHSLGRPEEALSVQRGILSIGDDGTKDPRTHAVAQVSARLNAGKLLLELGRPQEAASTLQEAERKVGQQEPRLRFPVRERQVLMNLLGEACQALNLTETAERWYRRAAGLKPDHVPAYLKYGKLLAKNVSLSMQDIFYARCRIIKIFAIARHWCCLFW